MLTMSPVSWLRLVTRTKQPALPGSSGRTWSASAALSSRRASGGRRARCGTARPVLGRPGCAPARRPARRGSYAAPRRSGQASRRVESAQVDVELPVGEASARRCAQCTARAVLPTPADPATTVIVPAAVSSVRRARSSSSARCPVRPANPATREGSGRAGRVRRPLDLGCPRGARQLRPHAAGRRWVTRLRSVGDPSGGAERTRRPAAVGRAGGCPPDRGTARCRGPRRVAGGCRRRFRARKPAGCRRPGL